MGDLLHDGTRVGDLLNDDASALEILAGTFTEVPTSTASGACGGSEIGLERLGESAWLW